MPLENKRTKELAICNVDKAGVLALIPIHI